MNEEKQPENTQNTINEAPENPQTGAEAEIDYELMASNPEAWAQSVADAEQGVSNDGQKSDAMAATVAFYESKIADLTQNNESLKAQLGDITNQYRRLAADFENFRKRTQKEKDEMDQQIKGNTIKELLSVIDNFELAKAHIKPQTEIESNIHKSYQSVYKQMVDTLKRLGVSAMYPEGKPFDPNFHEAVMRQPTADHPEGTVIEELRRGYTLGDRVLRHSMVKVAAAAEPVAPPEEDQEEETQS